MRERRWKMAALVAVGALVGVVMGATPAGGHVGGSVSHLWNQHIKPKTDARYYTKSRSNDRFFPGARNLPAGKTVRGTYQMGATAAAAFNLATSEISFGWRFAAAPIPHFIRLGQTPPAACPGTFRNPAARRGHLCVYEDFNENAGVRNVTTGAGDGTTYRFGAAMFIRSLAAGDFTSEGTWAATAGSPTSPRPTRDANTRLGE